MIFRKAFHVAQILQEVVDHKQELCAKGLLVACTVAHTGIATGIPLLLGLYSRPL